MMTQNCIICGKAVKAYTGHVLRGANREMITAGWCKEHLHISEDISMTQEPACFGPWKPEHGLRTENEKTEFEDVEMPTPC